jgi:methylmalonyl-CoA mutase N-terminal domain/subunit
MRLITDTFEFGSKYVPKLNTISISGYHIREAGATAVQEVAFTLADGIAYVEAAVKKGLDPNVFAQRLSFFFNSHIDFFEEIAKFRAARRIWARVMKERFKAKNPRSWMLRFHTQTAGCSLTAQQPYNNVVRTAFEGLAAVLGGTQSLHTNSLDEVLALPTEHSVTIALRTQQIIAEEIGVTNTIDPLAGSYFIEALTNKMEQAAMDYINKIDEIGGILKAIELGSPQQEIADAAYRYQQQIDTQEKIVVGVNKYVRGTEQPIELLKIDPEVEKRQMQRLKKIKQERDNVKVADRLGRLKDAAKKDENLMPYIIDAVREYASLQEICDVFRDVYGVFRDPAMF